MKKDYPAFPVTAGNDVYVTGMTLRDYFAAKASEGDISEHSFDEETDKEYTREQAKYRYADAMMAARDDV